MNIAKQIPHKQSIHWQFILHILPLTFGAGLVVVVYLVLFNTWGVDQLGHDFRLYFQPAVLSGAPYSVEGFYSPPWLLALYAPFAFLPVGVDIAALMVVSLTGWTYALHRLHATPLVIVLMLLTPHLQLSVLLGNYDFLIPLGLLLPPWLGLFLVLAKPRWAWDRPVQVEKPGAKSVSRRNPSAGA
jgi:hypothetical protein